MSRANTSPEQIGEELFGIGPSVGSADCPYGPGLRLRTFRCWFCQSWTDWRAQTESEVRASRLIESTSLAFCPQQSSFNTEPASAPNLVRCYHESGLRVNEKSHFGTQTALGECSSQSSDVGASNGCGFQNSLLIHCYSLIFVAYEKRDSP